MIARCLLLIVLFACLGCGGVDEGLVDLRKQASTAFDSAQQAFANKDFVKAKEQYALALQGGLYADFIEPAKVRLAVSTAASGDVENALKSLSEMEQGAENKAEVLAAKSYILAKQGKTAESQAAWAQAVRYNASVKKFGG
jgi:predicted negative regulator of RcsB-dependent stress response